MLFDESEEVRRFAVDKVLFARHNKHVAKEIVVQRVTKGNQNDLMISLTSKVKLTN